MSTLDLLHPDLLAPRLTDVDIAALVARGVRGVILDLDNTITPWHSAVVLPAVCDWLDVLRQAELHACVVTNAATLRRVQPLAKELNLPWVLRALKPLPGGFRRAMLMMGTTPAETAMIGDQVFTDIYGANRLGLYTILVDPLTPREALITRLLQRPLERLVGRTAK